MHFLIRLFLFISLQVSDIFYSDRGRCCTYLHRRMCSLLGILQWWTEKTVFWSPCLLSKSLFLLFENLEDGQWWLRLGMTLSKPLCYTEEFLMYVLSQCLSTKVSYFHLMNLFIIVVSYIRKCYIIKIIISFISSKLLDVITINKKKKKPSETRKKEVLISSILHTRRCNCEQFISS